MKFEYFMKSEEFKDFHDYFHCSRNNKYKFSKNKFETTLEYYQHLYKIVKINEEPFSGLPVLAYFLCLENCSNTKVNLDGSGLDEAHTGYDKYFDKDLSLVSNLYSSQDGTKSVIKNLINLSQILQILLIKNK